MFPQGWKVIYFISNKDAIYILEHPVTANHIQENKQSYVFEEISLHSEKKEACRVKAPLIVNYMLRKYAEHTGPSL